jgi:hypothetical protein
MQWFCATIHQFLDSEVKDPGLLNLIAQLTGLLLQVEVGALCNTIMLFYYDNIMCSLFQSLSESGNSLDLSSLTTSLGEVEKGVQPLNRK